MSSEDTVDAALVARARGLVRAEAKGLQGLEAQIDVELVELARRIVATPGRVITAGLGTSGEVARRMAHLLSVSGTPAFFLHPADALHGRLGTVTEHDTVIALSKGGQTDELNEFVRRARQRGAFVVAVTSDPRSEFARQASSVIALRSNDEAEPGGVIAMGSTLVVASWGDALSVVAMELRRYDWGEVLDTHPAGAVGHLQVEELRQAEGAPYLAAGRET